MTDSTYDVPQMQEEPLHSWITWTHNNNIPPQLQKESTVTLKMEVIHASKTETTWCQTPDHNMKSYLKNSQNLNLSRNQENCLENMISSNWSTYQYALLLYKKMYSAVPKKKMYAIHADQK